MDHGQVFWRRYNGLYIIRGVAFAFHLVTGHNVEVIVRLGGIQMDNAVVDIFIHIHLDNVIVRVRIFVANPVDGGRG